MIIVLESQHSEMRAEEQSMAHSTGLSLTSTPEHAQSVVQLLDHRSSSSQTGAPGRGPDDRQARWSHPVTAQSTAAPRQKNRSGAPSSLWQPVIGSQTENSMDPEEKSSRRTRPWRQSSTLPRRSGMRAANLAVETKCGAGCFSSTERRKPNMGGDPWKSLYRPRKAGPVRRASQRLLAREARTRHAGSSGGRLHIF